MANDSLPDAGIDTDLDIEQSGDAEPRSLTDDISALFDDGKTYVEAELAFQKTRLGYAANNGKSGIGLILAALGFLHLALIGLVVGGIISLIPYVGPLPATMIVVGTLLVGTAIFLLLAKRRFGNVSDAFKDDL